MFVNKSGEKYYYVVVSQSDLIVYFDKLEKLFNDSIPGPEIIKSVVFGKDNETFFVASDKGSIYQFSIEE